MATKSSLTISKVQDTVVLKIGDMFRDEDWSVLGGSFEAELTQFTGRPVTIDMSETAWADPTPLLQLAILLAQHRVRGGEIFVNLGYPRNAVDNRFLIFLAREGFLLHFLDQAEVFWDGEIY